MRFYTVKFGWIVKIVYFWAKLFEIDNQAPFN